MHRLEHFIKRTTGKDYPQQVICLGISAHRQDSPDKLTFGDSWQPHLALDEIYARKWRYEDGKASSLCDYETTKIDDFWSWCKRWLRSGSLTWLFADDLMTTLTVLRFWQCLVDGRFILTGDDHYSKQAAEVKRKRDWRGYIVMECPPSIVFCKSGLRGGNLRMVDLRNYGINVNQEKLEHFDRFRLTCNVVEQWIDVIRNHDLGTFQATAASQAMYTYKHKHMPVRTLLVHSHEKALRLERDALFPGRCECRFIGTVRLPELYDYASDKEYVSHKTILTDRVYHLDVRSMYPFLAATSEVPVRLLSYYEGEKVHWKPQDCPHVCHIVDCTVKTDVPYYPYRHEDIVIWPIGRFRTQLCGPELNVALRENHVEQIHSFAEYEGKVVFDSFVTEMLRLRNKFLDCGNVYLVQAIKAVTNALFGKFAQTSKRWINDARYVPDKPFEAWYSPSPSGEDLTQWRSIAGMTQYLTTIGEHPQSIPAITAYINSYGRALLLQLIEDALPVNVMYYDTDSLWVTREGYDNLASLKKIEQGMPGKLQVVGVHDCVDFRGIKYYVKDGKTVCAGLPCDARFDGNGKATVEAVETLKTSMWHGTEPTPNVIPLSVSSARKYRHGKVTDTGMVKPHQVWE